MTTQLEAPHRNRWQLWLWGCAASLLMVPLVAMQFTDEVKWDGADFIFAGVMLSIACGTYELAARVTGSVAYRVAIGIAVIAAFLLIWINLAVGIIGSENNPLNMMYAAVLATAVGGAVVARFRPLGMARAFVAAAVVQGLVAVAAQVAGHFTWVITAFFVILWLISAALLRKAAS